MLEFADIFNISVATFELISILESWKFRHDKITPMGEQPP